VNCLCGLAMRLGTTGRQANRSIRKPCKEEYEDSGEASKMSNPLVQGVVGEELRLARRALRRTRQALRYGAHSLASAPVFFANSFPKSGTHLLTQVMEGFTRLGPAVNSGLPAVVTFDGVTGRQRSESEILHDLQRLLPGDIAYGHLHAFPGAAACLCRDGLASYFILRDPRDVAVSHVHYITEMNSNHVFFHYYQDVLHSFDERLCASIQGITSRELSLASGRHSEEASLPNLRERFQPYTGWLAHPEMLVLHYEDFITARQAAIKQVLDHAVQRGFTLAVERQSALQILDQSIDPQHSPTFRSGKIGGWRAAFTEQHKRLFTDICGDLLIQLGYEENFDW
jgi:sulfotransferase 6B1